jgi:glycosyltransferase involved in cell wall biosynthesis
VLSLLDGDVVDAGHRSIVVACAGSTCAGELVPLPAVPSAIDEAAGERARSAVRAALDEVLAREPVDVVHLHGLDFDSYLPPPGPPVLVTLHLPLSWYAPGALRPARPDTHLHAVGAAQRAGAPDDLQLLGDIPNGVRLDLFRSAPVHDLPALCLGRLCPEKGFDLALEAAARVGLPLDVGGALFPYPEHVAWFEARLRPRLDATRRWLGPLGLEAKVARLARARCLVVPSLVPETASLVAMEALASGTPVVASRLGALPDLVEDGRTGLLVPPGDVDALADALTRIDTLDPADCRAAAEARCSAERTVAAYLARYRTLARPRATP